MKKYIVEDIRKWFFGMFLKRTFDKCAKVPKMIISYSCFKSRTIKPKSTSIEVILVGKNEHDQHIWPSRKFMTNKYR